MDTLAIRDEPDVVALDTGKSGSDFPLWAVKEAWAEAQTTLAEIEKARESLQKGAVSLIGWCVPIGSALCAVIASERFGIHLRIAAFGAAVPCAIALWRARSVMSVRGWRTDGSRPQDWYAIIENEDQSRSEASVTFERFRLVEANIEHNARVQEQMAQNAESAWLLFALIPLAGIAFWATARVASYFLALSS